MPFLNQLKDLLQVQTDVDFADLCGKRRPNMSNYLANRTHAGDSVLEDCLLNATVRRVFSDPPDEDTRLGKKAPGFLDEVTSALFGREIHPLVEVELVPQVQRDLPNSSGVYILYDSAANVLYIGQAKSFRAEVWQTLDRQIPVGMRIGPNMNKSQPIIRKLASYMSLYEINNPQLRHNIEALLIRVFINQTHNSNIGRFRTG